MRQYDYGGNKRGRAVSVNSNRISMRCLDCSKVSYLFKSELHRAARPRCMACGGTIEETDTAYKREFGRPKYKKKKEPSDPLRRCPGCGIEIGNNSDLYCHLTHNNDCLKHHIDSERCLPVPESELLIIPGTIFVNHPTNRTWVIQGISYTGEPPYAVQLELERFQTLVKANFWINEHFGPVQLAR